MRITKISLLAGTALLSLFVTSCHKDSLDSSNNEDSRVYFTRHDSTVNFSNFSTFKISDSVSIIKDGKFVKHSLAAYDSTLISALKAKMIERGFQPKAESSGKPDLGINVSRVITDYTGIINYDTYWGYYGDFWDPYFWGYGGYEYYFPYAFDSYSFREGAVSIDMLDLKYPDITKNKINTVWTGVGRGMGIFNPAHVNEEVSALFGQSPYLHK